MTLKGSYFRGANGYEEFDIDSLAFAGSAVTPPAPLTLTVTDIARGNGKPARYFQKVTVTPTEDLVMFDWSPKEMIYDGTWPGCMVAPYVFGFGMMLRSLGATPTAACTSAMSQPPGQAAVDNREVLIGTDFYRQFRITSDCQCAHGHSNAVPGKDTTWPSGAAMTGILIYDAMRGAVTGYQFLSPTDTGALVQLAPAPM
jgi:hypothetical protein